MKIKTKLIENTNSTAKANMEPFLIKLKDYLVGLNIGFSFVSLEKTNDNENRMYLKLLHTKTNVILYFNMFYYNYYSTVQAGITIIYPNGTNAWGYSYDFSNKSSEISCTINVIESSDKNFLNIRFGGYSSPVEYLDDATYAFSKLLYNNTTYYLASEVNYDNYKISSPNKSFKLFNTDNAFINNRFLKKVTNISLNTANSLTNTILFDSYLKIDNGDTIDMLKVDGLYEYVSNNITVNKSYIIDGEEYFCVFTNYLVKI